MVRALRCDCGRYCSLILLFLSIHDCRRRFRDGSYESSLNSWAAAAAAVLDNSKAADDDSGVVGVVAAHRYYRPAAVSFLRRPLRLVDILNPTTTTTASRGDNPSPANSDDDDDDVQELYFMQTLDHFGSTSSSSTAADSPTTTSQLQPRTFAQRYFVSHRYVRPNVVPHNNFVFVCVGGEGPSLDASVLHDDSSVHCSGDMLYTAQRLFAAAAQRSSDVSIVLTALEHRYYGQSYPNFTSSPVTNENLVYLSSRQATADLAHFIHSVFRPLSDESASTTTTRVVLFGGSYPGVLAAWTRHFYPHLVDAAVSNSAPVQAVVNLAAYQTHVGQVLRDTDAHCHDIVVTGHAILGELVADVSQHAALANQFTLCNATALSLRNQQLWLGDGVVYFGTQENDPSCADSYCNIAAKCRALTSRFATEMQSENATIATASVAALAWLAQTQRPTTGGACVDLDWEATVAYIADPNRTDNDYDEGLRSWLWQTCTEFGFYQTCTISGCPFAVGYHPLSQDLEVCRRAFGRDALSVARAVQATNEYTGGWHLQATRILSVTGTVDPWTEMSLQNARGRHDGGSHNDTTMPLYSVPGASHHFWTHPVRPTDDEAITAARDYILHTVQDWLFAPDDDSRASDATLTQ
jgi:thymus-specific serine protease